MENTTKLTYVNAFDYVLENCSLPEDVKEKIENAKAREIKKAQAKSGKVNEKALELQNKVLSVLANATTPMSVTSIANALTLDSDTIYTTQKITPVLKALGDKVTKTVEKGKALYSLS